MVMDKAKILVIGLSIKLPIYECKDIFNFFIFLQDVYFAKITWFWACAKFRTLVMVYS